MPIAARGTHPLPKPHRNRARIVAAVLLCLLGAGLLVPYASAGAGPKVVVVVGPVGRYNADYRREAALVVEEARHHTSNVVLVRSPQATWKRVKAATQGASILVYFGHGNGYPSVYGRFHGDTKNGMGLDPASGANGWRHVNYGEDRIRAGIRLAPNAAVLLYRLCYASGNTEPRMSEGSTSQSRQRVDGYGAGFIAAGAGVVIADGHPKPAGNLVRQLFTSDRSMLEMFRAAPNYHGHLMGPYVSKRTLGARYAMDPDKGGANPSGFYRSIVGNLDLTTREVTQRPPLATPPPSEDPSDPADTPSPDPGETPVPTEEPTPVPTEEPTPAPSGTASPTEEPVPSAAPEPTATAAPTAPPTEAPTAAPTETPGQPPPDPTASPTEPPAAAP